MGLVHDHPWTLPARRGRAGYRELTDNPCQCPSPTQSSRPSNGNSAPDSRKPLGLRVHRSISWIGRAEQATDDDGRFIFLWIAFNAAYADEEEHHNGIAGFEDWEERFRTSQRRSARALQARDTVAVLSLVFDRLYVLRNQLVHGGATWNSRVNRDQVRDGAAIRWPFSCPCSSMS